MASQKFVPPPERVDDLSEWEKALDVPHTLRDLFRYFFMQESDLNLKEPIHVLLDRYERGTEMEKQEARKILGKLQLIILNLMLYCSGYDYGQDNKEFITEPVKRWRTDMLTGNETYPRNFGNMHQTSRPASSRKFETPISPSEGWMFRMIDFKENFLKVVQSLNFYTPSDPIKQAGEIERKANSSEARYARRCIGRFIKAESPVLPTN